MFVMTVKPKALILIALIATLNPSFTHAQKSKVTYDIYLCIGQSNMAGRGPLNTALMDTLDGVFLLNSKGVFEPAVNPMNKYSTIRKDIKMQKLSPAYTFGKEMAKHSKHPIGLVVNARGGSSINSWIKGSKDGYYEEAIRRTRQALAQGGKLKGIIWHQGEADCGYPESWIILLRQMISDFRHDLGVKHLPVVVGEISQWEGWAKERGTKRFNNLIKYVDEQIPYVKCATSEGLGWSIGNHDPHFSTEAQLEFGKRYAQKMLEF